MTDMVERVARVFCGGMGSFNEPNDPDFMVRCMDGEMRPRWMFFSEHARAAIAAIPIDDDIQALLRWLDFKQSGKGPGDQEWVGARKLLEAFGFKP